MFTQEEKIELLTALKNYKEHRENSLKFCQEFNFPDIENIVKKSIEVIVKVTEKIEQTNPIV